MRWEKQGRIFNVEGGPDWMAHHAQIPTPHLIDDERLRIYFATRDSDNRSRVSFVDVDPGDPSKLLYVHDRPALDLGRLGTFDDSGVMPSSVITVGEKLYLYYLGNSRGSTVPYHVAIGLAISTDGGETFTRSYEGPILGRGPFDPYLTGSPFVLREQESWSMWYLSGTEWVVRHDHPEPVYVIKYAQSDDGITWQPRNVTCIKPASSEEALARPWVVHDGESYRMWYCSRSSTDYRSDPAQAYSIGYAESADGINWERRDDRAGIELSDHGWDSEMLAYPAIYEHRGTQHLLYNGNGFGTTGIGHAVAAG